MSLSYSGSSAGKRVCVCACLGGSNVISCPAILSTYIPVTCMLFLGKGHSHWMSIHGGTMARLIEPCVPFVSVSVCVCVYMSEYPPSSPASHRKGLFGFIVQEGLCAQLAHLYKFSLYGVLWDTWTHTHTRAHTYTHTCFQWGMTLPCICSHYIAILPSTRVWIVCLFGWVHVYFRTHPSLDWSISVWLSVVRKKRVDDCFSIMSL